MSLLLDALRKSANERRLGTTPGLEDGLRQVPPAVPKRRSWLSPLLLVTILVLLFIWQPWQTTGQSDEDAGEMPIAAADDSADGQAVAQTDTAAVANVQPDEPVAAAQGDQVHTGQLASNQVATTQPPAAQQPQPTAANQQVANTAEELPGTRQSGGDKPGNQGGYPDDEYEDDYGDDSYYGPDDSSYVAQQLRLAAGIGAEDGDTEEDVAVAEELLEEMIKQAQKTPEYTEFARQVADSEVQALEEGTDGLPGVGEDEFADEDPPPGYANAGQPKARREVLRAETGSAGVNDGFGVLSYYDLPVNVRTAMPNVNVQIRVYDEEPERRFVVTGRSRLHEGEEIADGVRLHEIRRDGVVLTYQNYVFLWDKR